MYKQKIFRVNCNSWKADSNQMWINCHRICQKNNRAFLSKEQNFNCCKDNWNRK